MFLNEPFRPGFPSFVQGRSSAMPDLTQFSLKATADQDVSLFNVTEDTVEYIFRKVQ